MIIMLYHDNEPQGRAFDQDSAKEAKLYGWYDKSEKVIKTMFPEEDNKNAVKKRKVRQSSKRKYTRVNKKRQTSEASGGDSIESGEKN